MNEASWFVSRTIASYSTKPIYVFGGFALFSWLCAAGAFGWAGPMAYLLVTESALAAGWTTPWIWPARPPHDRGAAICAGLAFSAGIVAVTLLGARDAGHRAAPE